MNHKDERLLELLLGQDVARQLVKHNLAISAEFTANEPGVNVDWAKSELTHELEEQRRQHGSSFGLALLGQLSAELVHEVRNMTNTLHGFAKLAARSKGRPERLTKLLDAIEAQAKLCADTTAGFLMLAQEGQIQVLDVNSLVSQAVSLLTHSLRAHDIDIDVQLARSEPTLRGNYNDLLRVLINLLHNAQEAIQRDGKITVTTAVHPPNIELSVVDSGPGVPEELRVRIFDSLFTTKAVERGTGLGLTFSARIVTENGGSIHVDDAPGGGARFVLRFPMAAEADGA